MSCGLFPGPEMMLWYMAARRDPALLTMQSSQRDEVNAADDSGRATMVDTV